jgi:asparagine synthase (glutamine-hydrolysing)
VIFHSTVLPVILRNYDRLSMAHGVEVRMPFLDWRLVTFAFFSARYQPAGVRGYTKLVLRRAMRQTLPPSHPEPPRQNRLFLAHVSMAFG